MSAGEEAAFTNGYHARRTYVSFTAIVLLPIGIGFAAGIYTAAIFVSFCLVLDVPLRYSLLPASIAAAAAWMYSLRWVHTMIKDTERALWAIAHGKLIASQPLLVETHMDNNRVVRRTDLGANYEQQIEVAKLVLNGGTISQGSCLRYFNGNRQEFQSYQQQLVAAGWGRWRSPNAPQQGMEITDLGMAEFQRMIDNQTPLPHYPDVYRQNDGFTLRTRALAGDDDE